MSPRPLIILLFLFVVQEVYAQKFLPGYYVNSSGDTVKANLFLRKKGGEITGLEVEGGKHIGKGEVKALGLDGVNYVVRVATLDKSPKGPINVVDTVVMEIMSREKISLLASIDQYDKSHYFIELEDGKVEELGLRFLDKGNKVTFQELPSYKDKLKALFPDCQPLFPEIDNTRYTKRSIKSVYEKLYQYKFGSKPKIEGKKDVANDFGLTIGMSSTKLSFNDTGHGGVAAATDWPKSNNITGGIFMDNKFARTRMFSLRQELVYRSYKTTGKDLSGTPGLSIVGSVSASYLKYNLIGRIALSHGAFKPFLAAGVSPSLLLSSSSGTKIVNGGSERTEELLGKNKGFEFGYVGGAGIMYDDFCLEARMELSNGLDSENYNTKVNTFYLMLSYRLFEGKR